MDLWIPEKQQKRTDTNQWLISFKESEEECLKNSLAFGFKFLALTH